MTARRTFVLVVPMPINVANTPMHWAKKNRLRGEYFQKLDNLHLQKKIPNAPARALAKASISSVMYLGKIMDTDNAISRHKWVLDWMKTRGFIVDDKPGVLSWSAFPCCVVKHGEEHRIEITLTEAA
jgi:hypothetical protein